MKAGFVMKLIADALCQLGEGFDPEFLAYSALTGKIEKELCSSLAWSIRRKTNASDVQVIKEHNLPSSSKRFDLALLRRGELYALIEAKQWRGFDFAGWSGKDGGVNLVKGTVRDIEKLRAVAVQPDCRRYILSFCVHSVPLPSETYGSEIKYLRETIQCGLIDEATINSGFERLLDRWGGLRVVAKGSSLVGQVLGVKVFLHYWMMEVRLSEG